MPPIFDGLKSRTKYAATESAQLGRGIRLHTSICDAVGEDLGYPTRNLLTSSERMKIRV